jgi:putative NAD(P)-binding protein
MPAERSSDQGNGNVAADGTQVTIAGGGIAGLTAALRLAERGCTVTLYEAKDQLGGNLASGLPSEKPRIRPLGIRAMPAKLEFDVYPHMYQAWYRNFWSLLSDSGVSMERVDGKLTKVEGFTSFSSFHQLRKGQFGKYTTLTDPYSMQQMLANISSGVADPADMFAMGYAGADLQAEATIPTVRLRNMSLTGYLNSRPYMSTTAVEAYETFITTVWGIPAYLISASDYRDYAAYCYGAAEEPAWLSCGPAADTIINPLEKSLKAKRTGKKAKGSVKIVRTTRIAGVTCEPGKPGRVSTITLEETEFKDDAWIKKKGSTNRVEKVENLVLALPPKPLAEVVRSAAAGRRITDIVPRLRGLARVQTEPMPMLHLSFKKKLKDIPREPVALLESQLKLAFTDISQTRDDPAFLHAFPENTVLAVSCSEPAMLPGDIAGGLSEDADAMAKELKEYVRFKDEDLDRAQIHYRENTDAQLSLNAVGTETSRPQAHCDEVENLYFAGDFCENPFGITTVEAAVATGLEAVNALVQRRALGAKFEIEIPDVPPASDFLAIRYTWWPAAYAARAVSKASKAAEAAEPSDPGRKMLRYLLTPGLRPG